ncbi:MAG: AAA family ATPase [Bacillota bacterium]
MVVSRLSSSPVPEYEPLPEEAPEGAEGTDIRSLRRAAGAEVLPFRQNRRGTSPEVITQQIVVVCGPKGGVGKTFLASNLAAAIAERSKLQVGLLDLDLAGGEAGLYLDLLEGPSLQDLLPSLKGGLSQDHLLAGLVIHRPTGTRVLLSPARPELSEAFGVGEYQTLVAAARREFQIIIVDTPSAADNDLLYEALETATMILLLTTPDTASLRRCKVMIDLMKRLNLPVHEKLRVVLNLAGSSARVTPAGVQAFLGLKLLAIIGEDRKAVDTSLFEGIPLVLSHRQHPVALSLMKVANEVCPIFLEPVRPNRLARAFNIGRRA